MVPKRALVGKERLEFGAQIRESGQELVRVRAGVPALVAWKYHATASLTRGSSRSDMTAPTTERESGSSVALPAPQHDRFAAGCKGCRHLARPVVSALRPCDLQHESCIPHEPGLFRHPARPPVRAAIEICGECSEPRFMARRLPGPYPTSPRDTREPNRATEVGNVNREAGSRGWGRVTTGPTPSHTVRSRSKSGTNFPPTTSPRLFAT